MKNIVFILLLGCSIGIAFAYPELKESNGSGNYTLTVRGAKSYKYNWADCLQETIDYVKYPRVGFSIDRSRWWLELIFHMDEKNGYSPDIYFVTANGPNQPRIRCYSMQTFPSRLCWVDGDPSNYNDNGDLILNINRVEPLSLTFKNTDVENMKFFTLSVPYALLQNSCHFIEDYDNFKVTLIISKEHGTWTIKVSGFAEHFPDGLSIVNKKSKQQFSCDKSTVIFGFKLRSCEVIGRLEQLPGRDALVLEFVGRNTGIPFTTLLRSERHEGVKDLSEEESSEILLRSEQITINPKEELGLTVIEEDEKNIKMLTLNVPDALLKDNCFITEEHGDLMISFIRSNEDWIWIIIITGFEKDFPQGFEITKVNNAQSKLRFNCNKYIVRFGHESRSCELIGGFKDLPKKVTSGVRRLVVEFSGEMPENPPTTLLKTLPPSETSKGKTTGFDALMASKRLGHEDPLKKDTSGDEKSLAAKSKGENIGNPPTSLLKRGSLPFIQEKNELGRKDLPKKDAPAVDKSLAAESKGENIGNPPTSPLQRESSPFAQKKEEIGVTVKNEGEKSMKITLSLPSDSLQKDGFITKNHGGIIFIYLRSNRNWNWAVIIAGYEKYFPRGFEIIQNRKSDLKINCNKSLFVYGGFFGRYLRACEVIGGFEHLPRSNKNKPHEAMDFIKFKGDNTETPFNTLPQSETED